MSGAGTTPSDHVTRTMVVEAIDELTLLETHRCTDPAMAAALRVVRLTKHTLQHLWLSALCGTCSSEQRCRCQALEHGASGEPRQPVAGSQR